MSNIGFEIICPTERKYFHFYMRIKTFAHKLATNGLQTNLFPDSPHHVGSRTIFKKILINLSIATDY